ISANRASRDRRLRNTVRVKSSASSPRRVTTDRAVGHADHAKTEQRAALPPGRIVAERTLANRDSVSGPDAASVVGRVIVVQGTSLYRQQVPFMEDRATAVSRGIIAHHAIRDSQVLVISSGNCPTLLRRIAADCRSCHGEG